LFLVIGGYVWLNRRQIASASVLRDRLGDLGAAGAGVASAPILKQPETESRLDRYLAGRSFASVVEEETRRSGIGWTPAQFASYVVAGVSVGSISAFWLPFAYALPLGVIGALMPFFMVARRRKQRERLIEEQLPDAVEMLVNSMKAGFSLQAGMNFVGMELPAPTGPEFARFYDEQRLGIDVKQALLSLQDRLGTLDARMLVLAILIQRETGGNLGEILGNISKVIRERINFRDHVGVLTAESKMSAVILSLLPVLLFFVIQFSNPEYIAELTNSSTGQLLLGYGAVSLTVGFALLMRMSRIEV
jgi:tight adherence protein B